MLSNEQIDTVHRLHFVEKWSVRKIAAHMRVGRRSVAKYLETPVPAPPERTRTSTLDPFKPVIQEWLEKDPSVTAAVIRQRLQERGFSGGRTIVCDYVYALRQETRQRRAYVRMEPAPGERFEIDWGHFGALIYDGTPRKLYAFCLIECHSRKMYVEFTHSQTFETLVRCHIHAFQAMGGVVRELWFDNMATVVAEHDGNLVRFHPRFLGFAREYGFIPRACHVGAAWEKGKVERAIGYVRQNFWPLRTFTSLTDVNAQVHQWLGAVANQRRHRETRQTPDERFCPEALASLPAIHPDYRDTSDALVHKDLRLAFDGNRYCVPPRYVGHRLTIKADSSSLTIYDQHQEIVSYPRSWKRGHTFGAERFQKELLSALAAAQRSADQQRLVAMLGPASELYLGRIATTDRSFSRQIRELLLLVRDYGPDAVAGAIAKAHASGAFGADYVANIVRQQRSPRDVQPPLCLKNPILNQLATDPLSLAQYDAFILASRKDFHELAASETDSPGSDDNEPSSRSGID